MPPPGRGRGRGRGRGKAVPAAEPPAGTVPETAVSTPEHMHIDPSPNSSPATIPTETPAPTPARASTLRPDGPSNSGPSGTLRSRPGAKEAAAPSKFKPKNIRRGATEREELARKEMQRVEDLAKQAARDDIAALRGRGRGAGRGRGDAMGRKVEPRTTASGTFGIAPAEYKKANIQSMSTGGGGFDADDYNLMGQGGRGLGTGGVGSGGGGGGAGGGGSGWSGSRENPLEVEYPADLDEGNIGPLIDIEKIGVVSDDDDVVITGSRVVNRKGGLRPVRLPRHEHQERNPLLNELDAPLIKKEEDLDDDDDVIMTDAVLRTVPQAETQYIKPDPDLEPSFNDAMALESSPNFTNPDTLPESLSSAVELVAPATPSRKVKVKPPTSPELNKKAKEVPVHQEQVFACEEDKAEYARHMEDVAILAAELGGLHPRNDGDMDIDAEPDKREGRLYLFQFPPILPKLYNPLTTEKPPLPGSLKIKEEPQTELKNGTGKSKGKPVDLSADEIKPEAEEIVAHAEKVDKNKRVKRDRVVDEQGYVGKMIVRESGKVELSWGGTSLVVGRGVDASFLTTGVVMDANMRGARPGVPAHEIEGRAIGMGKIMGKFVVTPDFEKMFGADFS